MTTLYLILFFYWWLKQLLSVKQQRWITKPKNKNTSPNPTPIGYFHHQQKPDWVPVKIIYLKAHLPNDGCRKIAAVFNRINAVKKISVSKSYVANIIKQHRYDILIQRRNLKNKRPYPVDKNKYWGIDLTFFTDCKRERHTVIGICEHHSRLALSLSRLRDKSSITLLRCILDAVEKWAKPNTIRTDNEPVFTSKLFRFGLWFLGIKHQTTELHSPWQNGKIERLFGTLKRQLSNTAILDRGDLKQKLRLFQCWYNHIRPHQNLGDKTPIETWHGIDVFQNPKRHWEYVCWDGGRFLGFYPRE